MSAGYRFAAAGPPGADPVPPLQQWRPGLRDPEPAPPALPPGPVVHAPPPPGYATPGPAPVPLAAPPLPRVAADEDRYTQELAREQARQTQADYDWVGLRFQAVDRTVAFNRRHAELAWTNRRSQRVSPYGLAFFYSDPITDARDDAARHSAEVAAGRAYLKVVAATHVVPDEEGLPDVETFLFRMVRLARTRYRPFDPAVQMSIYHDPASGNAEYIGLAVSTLDTPSMTWAQAQTSATTVEDVGGRSLILLADNRIILIDRSAPRGTQGRIDVHSTGQLNFGPVAARPWTYHAEPSKIIAATGRPVWDFMSDLHHLTYNQTPRPTL